MRTVISSKGQIVLPADLRQMDGIRPVDEFDIERLEKGDYRFVRRTAPPSEGVIDWLLSCPHKGYFTPIASESTNTV